MSAGMTSRFPQLHETAVKERPIIMTGESVRAILDARKSQTRRVVDPQPALVGHASDPMWSHPKMVGEFAEHVIGYCMNKMVPCPFGVTGDRLWVRETWHCPRQLGGTHQREKLIFRANAENPNVDYSAVVWQSPIHMPRWASRLTLEITGVRVERLQEITNDDAMAEGAPDEPTEAEMRSAAAYGDRGDGYWSPHDCVDGFQNQWNRLNEKRGYSWESNPWVWVIEFRVFPQLHDRQ